MPEPPAPPELDPATRRSLAIGLYNRAWQLLDLADRTPQQDDELIHTAHASRHHWGEVGAPVNLARGEWLCSRVYAVLGRGEPALHHASRCLAILEGYAGKADRGGAEDWDLADALEALARAHAVAGDAAESRRWIVRAQEACAAIADPEDRAVIERDLESIPR
jgi:hypothetical protein